MDLEVRSLASRRLNVNSLTEAIDALKASRQRIIRRGGFTPKYTQAELLQLVDEGLDNDRYIVRLVEKRHVNRGGDLQGTLGRQEPGGDVRYWSTTLDQVEHNDTDPRAIAEQLGVEYNPEATYKLAIIDKEIAREKADARTFVPTFDNLKRFLRENIHGYADTDELLDLVMTPEYQAKYEKVVEGFGDAEWNDFDVRSDYLAESGLDEKEQDVFEARFAIQEDTGASQYYLGNGLTKQIAQSSDKAIHGAVETLTREKKPQTFNEMTNGGKGGPGAYVKLVNLTPIDFGE